VRRITLILSVVPLVALAACGDDDETTSTVETTPSTPAPTVDTTTVPSDHEDCLYRDDLVFVRGAEPADPPAELTGPLEVGDLAEVLGLDDPEDAERLGGLLESGQLAAYSVADGADPLELADLLEETEDLEASPVLLTTITGHWTFAPGAPPTDGVDAPAQDPGEGLDFNPEVFVAVVDTGYSEDEGTPAWLADRVDPLAARDAESGALPLEIVGHGKFVASVIAQEAPAVGVVVAAMRNLTADDTFYGDLPGLAASGFTTDEVQLYLAVGRLAGSSNFGALNLSLGSYQCPVLNDSGFAIREAVNLWNREAGTPIVAAAGNHDPAVGPSSVPFIPAAYASDSSSNVFAVASIGASGSLSSFSNAADVTAIGENLIGVRIDGEWAAWSGSSFATAVVSAEIAKNGPLPTIPTTVPLSAIGHL
jgi:hypothetical protein